MNTALRFVSAAGLLSLGLLTASGCAAVDALLYKHTTTTYGDAEAARAAGVDAAWIPTDATEVVVRTSTDSAAPDAVIMLRSPSALSVDDCTEVERQSAPTWVLDGMPDAYTLTTVFVCGDWSVMPTDTGWAGWTPNSQVERDDAVAMR